MPESGQSIDAISEHWINPDNTYKRVIELERIARDLGYSDCVFNLGKESAIDLLSILEHQQIRVPDQLRVISVDGTFDGLKTTPTLTYVKQDFEKMATIAAEKMRFLCSPKTSINEERKTERILVAPQLVIRESA
jgi:DNA-binding LacI/PurR family transcriptional regulator